MKKNSLLYISLLAIAACMLWSTAFVGVKIGLKYAKPLSFAGIRFLISGIILFPFCGGFSVYLSTLRKNFKTIILVSFFQTFLLYSLFYLGMTMVPGATGAIIIGSSPLFFAVAAHFSFKHDKLTLHKIISIGIGIAGVVIISVNRDYGTNGNSNQLLGILLLILGSISSAAGNIIVTKERNNINPLILNSAQIGLGGILLLIFSLPFEGIPVLIHPLPFYLVLAWLSMLSAVAFSIWFYLLKIPDIKVSELNLWKFIIPVAGALLSWVLLTSESPSLSAFLGMFFVGGAIIYYNITQRHNGTPKEQ